MEIGVTVSSDGGVLSADLAALSAVAAGLPGRLANVAAEAGTPALLLAARELRGSLTMSNNKRGTRLDVLPIVKDDGASAQAELVAVPRGVWHLSEYGGRGPYEIKPRARSKAKAVATPYGPRRRVTHPGARGRPVFAAAAARAEEVIDRHVQDAFDSEIAGAIGD